MPEWSVVVVWSVAVIEGGHLGWLVGWSVVVVEGDWLVGGGRRGWLVGRWWSSLEVSFTARRDEVSPPTSFLCLFRSLLRLNIAKVLPPIQEALF